MKKTSFLVLTSLLAFSLAACGSNEAMDELEENKKTSESVASENIETTEEESTEDVDASSEESNEEPSDKIWTYYDGAKQTEKWEDLSFDINRVATTNDFPTYDDDSNDVIKSAVAIDFLIKNNSKDKMYSTYPDQAVLITNTGEQIEMTEMWESDSIGGEIHEGVEKEGTVVWVLEKTKVEDLKWVKLTWNSSYEDPDGNYDLDKYKDHSVKVELK